MEEATDSWLGGIYHQSLLTSQHLFSANVVSIQTMNNRKRQPLLESEDSSSKRPKISIMFLENEIASLRAELEHERSLREIDQRRAAQVKARLERQVQFASEEADEAKSLLEDLRATSDEHIASLRQGRHDALLDLRECQAALADLAETNEARFEMSAAKEKITCLEAQLEACKEEVVSLAKRLKEMAEDASQHHHSAQVESNKDANLQPLDSNSSGASETVLRELSAARIALAESERKYRQLNRKAEEWSKKAQQLVQLKEVSSAVKLRNTKLERDLKALQCELESNRATQAQWGDFVKEIGKSLDLAHSGPPEATAVMRYFQKHRQQVKMMETEFNALKIELKNSKDTIASLQKSIRETTRTENQLQRDLKNAQLELDQALLKSKALQAQEHIWQREADSLRSLVRSFDEMPLGQPIMSEDATKKSLHLALTTAREESAVLKQENERMSLEISKNSAARQALEKEIDRVSEKFAKLREALIDERNKVEDAEDRALKAETLIGKGLINPEVTRILHCEKNPLMDAIHERYRREIKFLTAKLEHSTGENPVMALAPSKPDVDPEKLHQRLKDTFKEQIGIFREGVYLITGYKIDMLLDKSTPYFKVRSVYAEREDDVLVFNWPKGVKQPKSLELRGTDFAQLLITSDSYEYLTKYDSMPGFMAGTQLALLEKCTFVSAAATAKRDEQLA